MTEDLHISETTTNVEETKSGISEADLKLPTIDAETQRVIIEKGANIVARLAGIDVKPVEDKRSVSIQLTKEEYENFNLWSEELARKKIIPRASMSSVIKFSAVQYLEIINDQVRKQVQKQQEVKKSDH
ncbi:hypothetical protein NTE_01217 [Candidatus Nitrososphaera evergladensis SR1]|uniref:Uncharacterized protein n=1 Tax=Candidatus Nitrososphaera evergladensis SR1 TaxID=1459636 RepID=A0A075MVJ6_9ARCH|nr:hypothetical protein [Candidatus Nitrososphaera evergladensis]AIF83289.1 hypothetical protein NTE_01217 [Candidatus Nitrososphaera evergladensis SR1]